MIVVARRRGLKEEGVCDLTTQINDRALYLAGWSRGVAWRWPASGNVDKHFSPLSATTAGAVWRFTGWVNERSVISPRTPSVSLCLLTPNNSAESSFTPEIKYRLSSMRQRGVHCTAGDGATECFPSRAFANNERTSIEIIPGQWIPNAAVPESAMM